MATTGNVNPVMVTYLGQRMQAVHDVVTASSYEDFTNAWPFAEHALFLQGVDTSDILFPEGSAGIGRFSCSILARAKPSFTNSLNRIANLDNDRKTRGGNRIRFGRISDQHIKLRREMIELGALHTYAEVGLIEPSVVTAIENIMMTEYSHYKYDSPLMEDLATLNAFLDKPVDDKDAWWKMLHGMFKTYVTPDEGVWEDYLEELYDWFGEIEDTIANHPRGLGQLNAEQRTLVLNVVKYKTFYITELRPGIISSLQLGIEQRLMFEVLGDPGMYTVEDIQQIYDWGFITDEVYRRAKDVVRSNKY